MYPPAGGEVGCPGAKPLQICLECRSTCLPAGRKAKSVTTCPETSGNNLPIAPMIKA